MADLTITAKKLIITVIAIFFAGIAGATVFYWGDIEGFFRFALGLFLGSACSCIRIASMDVSVRNSVETVDVKGGAVAYLIRYFLTAAVLVVAFVFDIFNHWAAVAGILALPLAAYIVPIISKQD